MKLSENFHLNEFIDPETYAWFGEKSIWFIDKRVISLAQFIRSRHKKPVTINNWATGGSYKLSGFRPPETTIGGKLSQHRFGRAIDVKVKGLTPQELYKDITDNQSLYMKVGLTCVENVDYTPSWTHLDVRETNSSDILIVNP